MKLSRRDILGTALLAAAAPASGQEAAPDWLAAAAEQNKRNAEALERVGLPQSTEPAYAFKP